MKADFTLKIIEWHVKQNKRIMPWKGIKDPYRIWISEIILQQTRVLQGLVYYNNFIKEFPTLESLAKARDEAVFKVWEGLGYYSRCKNIIFTAKHIVNNLEGTFPTSYNNILALKGIGPYTAAAISSFAYGLPHAVVDGNVLRVLSRYFGEATPIDSTQGKQFFTNLAQELLYADDPAAYNQAIMDFGAIVCKPQVPACQHCILQHNCIAYKNGLVNKLPVKEKTLVKKHRWFTYFVFTLEGYLFINKRTEKDIWQNLYEFYLFETESQWKWKPEQIATWLHEQLGIKKFTVTAISELFKQQLTHQNLQGKFITIELNEDPPSLSHFTRIKKESLSKVPFPKFINQFLTGDNIISD